MDELQKLQNQLKIEKISHARTREKLEKRNVELEQKTDKDYREYKGIQEERHQAAVKAEEAHQAKI